MLHQSRMHFLIFVVVVICAEARKFSMPNVGKSLAKPPSQPYAKNSCASLSLTKLNKTASFFPWMAKLHVRETDWRVSACTATIVSRNYLLTAGHCVEKMIEGAVYLGSANVKNAERHEVNEGIKHHAYEIFPLIHPFDDIALLKLKHPLKFDYVRTAPICLARGKSTQTEGTIAGWGQNQLAKKCPRDPGDGDNINIMGSGQVKIEPGERADCLACKQCSESNNFLAYFMHFFLRRLPNFFHHKNDDGKFICANALNAVADHGDSGGPLMVQKAGGGWQQIGVASFIRGCHTPTPMPMGYTAVNHYCDWITETTRGEVKCVD